MQALKNTAMLIRYTGGFCRVDKGLDSFSGGFFYVEDIGFLVFRTGFGSREILRGMVIGEFLVSFSSLGFLRAEKSNDLDT